MLENLSICKLFTLHWVHTVVENLHIRDFKKYDGNSMNVIQS